MALQQEDPRKGYGAPLLKSEQVDMSVATVIQSIAIAVFTTTITKGKPPITTFSFTIFYQLLKCERICAYIVQPN